MLWQPQRARRNAYGFWEITHTMHALQYGNAQRWRIGVLYPVCVKSGIYMPKPESVAQRFFSAWLSGYMVETSAPKWRKSLFRRLNGSATALPPLFSFDIAHGGSYN